jgi:hypothetical protein
MLNFEKEIKPSVNQRVLGSSPRGGANKEKTSQRCEVFFGFTCHTFVKQIKNYVLI